MIIQNGKLVSLYDKVQFILEYFMTYKTPSSAKKHRESTNQKVTRWLNFCPVLSILLCQCSIKWSLKFSLH